MSAKVEARPSIEQAGLARLALYLQAVGQPHRLRILKALSQSELCACELGERVGISASLQAHHLKVLRRAGLIQVRREDRDARWLYYSVSPDALAELRGLFSGIFPAGELPPEAQLGSNLRCV